MVSKYVWVYEGEGRGAHEMTTTAAVSERRELEPRRAIVTVKAATSCSAHTVIGTAVAISTYVEGAEARTIPSIIACSSHALTRMAAPHAAAAPRQLQRGCLFGSCCSFSRLPSISPSWLSIAHQTAPSTAWPSAVGLYWLPFARLGRLLLLAACLTPSSTSSGAFCGSLVVFAAWPW